MSLIKKSRPQRALKLQSGQYVGGILQVGRPVPVQHDDSLSHQLVLSQPLRKARPGTVGRILHQYVHECISLMLISRVGRSIPSQETSATHLSGTEASQWPSTTSATDT